MNNEISEKDFNVWYNNDDSKIWIQLLNDHEDVLFDIVVCDIDSNFPIFFENNITLSKHYFVWVHTGYEHFRWYSNFNGYNVYLRKDDVIIKKEIRLRNEPILCNIDFYPIENYKEPDNYFSTFHSDIYKELKINEKDNFIIDLGSGTGLFVGYALQKGAKNIIGVEANPRCVKICKHTFNKYNNVNIIEKAICVENNKDMILNVSELDTATYNGTLIQNVTYLEQKIEVKTITLENIIIDYNIDKIDVLKCDIEGYEWIFFDSLSDNVLGKINRIYLETHLNSDGRSGKLLERLKNIGFDYITMNEESYLNDINSGIIFYKKN